MGGLRPTQRQSPAERPPREDLLVQRRHPGHCGRRGRRNRRRHAHRRRPHLSICASSSSVQGLPASGSPGKQPGPSWPLEFRSTRHGDGAGWSIATGCCTTVSTTSTTSRPTTSVHGNRWPSWPTTMARSRCSTSYAPSPHTHSSASPATGAVHRGGDPCPGSNDRITRSCSRCRIPRRGPKPSPPTCSPGPTAEPWWAPEARFHRSRSAPSRIRSPGQQPVSLSRARTRRHRRGCAPDQ